MSINSPISNQMSIEKNMEKNNENYQEIMSDYLFLQNNNNSFNSLMYSKEKDSFNSFDTNRNLNQTESQYTLNTVKKRINFKVTERYGEIENIGSTISDIDYSLMKNLGTMPPKYSDENDIRNNIICANNNIYIYAENKNGTLNQEACISVSNDNNIIYCSTKGRRYTIGGYANINKKTNNEYIFFEENPILRKSSSTNIYSSNTIRNSDALSSLFNKNDLSQTKEISIEDSVNKIITPNSMNDISKESFDDSTSPNNTVCVNKNFSVEKLFKDYKKYTQNLEHEQRTCKPCAHVYNGNTCMNGDDCAFCHHHDHVLISAKKWKKLVKNNMEKLNILLHIMHNPSEANLNLLNEIMKPNTRNIPNNKRKNNVNSNSKMIYNNMKNKKNNKNPINYIQQKNSDRILKANYNFLESNETVENNKTRNLGYNKMGFNRMYNNTPLYRVNI